MTDEVGVLIYGGGVSRRTFQGVRPEKAHVVAQMRG